MSKRFTDTNKYKKSFFRSLPGPYKLLWDYLYHDCDHAGIWHVDFEVAQIYVGKDMPINSEEAIRLFNESEQRIIILNGGSKWFIPSFISFQYGELNPTNRAHASVLSVLEKEEIKGLASHLHGAMDKDKDKDMDKDKDKDKDKVKDKVKKNKKALTSIPEDFRVSDRVRVWAMEKGYKNLDDHLDSFKRKVAAKGYQYADWDSAFMEAIRENWAKIGITGKGFQERDKLSGIREFVSEMRGKEHA